MLFTNYVLVCTTVALVLVDIPDHLGAYLHAVHEAHEHTEYVELLTETVTMKARPVLKDGSNCQI